jgi:enamine deaminase RidA (YjgF/YER057c/UK114 family)
MEQKVINPWAWQDRAGFVQATEITGGQRMLFCSGQASIGPDGNVLHPGDMAAQLNQSIDNLETVLKEAGFGMENVVRLNIFTTDVDLFLAGFQIILARVTGAGAKFSSTLIGVTRLAAPDLLIEIEATAVK